MALAIDEPQRILVTFRPTPCGLASSSAPISLVPRSWDAAATAILGLGLVSRWFEHSRFEPHLRKHGAVTGVVRAWRGCRQHHVAFAGKQ